MGFGCGCIFGKGKAVKVCSVIYNTNIVVTVCMCVICIEIVAPVLVGLVSGVQIVFSLDEDGWPAKLPVLTLVEVS